MYQQIMTKNIAKIVAGIGLAAGLSGCSTEDFNGVIKDTPVDWAFSSTRYALGGDTKQNQEQARDMTPRSYIDGTLFIPELNDVKVDVKYSVKSMVNYKPNAKRKIGAVSQGRIRYNDNKTKMIFYSNGIGWEYLTTDNLQDFSINGTNLDVLIYKKYGNDIFTKQAGK